MKDSYLTAGIRIRPLLHLLARNRVSITPVTLGRVLFLLQSAFWSSFFSRLEQLRYGELLKQIPQPTNPIFIIGHWRTGSTFLHQLMSRDPGLAAPTLFQVALPENFLISYRFYKPILGSLLGEYRPMDNVKIGFDEPQEDEYAIFRLTSFSPLEQLLFPRKKEYFLFTARFLPKTDDLEQYGKSLANFYKKIVFISGKKVISKNPFNSLRIPFLSALFPEAKFIHIVRHPYAIVPSTRHLWNVIQKQNVLNRNGYIPTLQEITSFLYYMTSSIQQEFARLPSNRCYEIRYEDLEKNPVETLGNLYSSLNMTFSSEAKDGISSAVKELSGFKKHLFMLTPKEKNEIREIMRMQMECYTYSENE